MNIKKILYIIFGCISFGLGAVGAVLPVLPTFPFLIFAAFCFARSSKKLDKWFKGTKLYKNNLETYAKGQGMTRKTKVYLKSFSYPFILLRNISFYTKRKIQNMKQPDTEKYRTRYIKVFSKHYKKAKRH